MLSRIVSILRTGVEFIDAEARLTAYRLTRVALAGSICVAFALVSAIALISVLVGLGMLLAPTLGLAGSMIVAGVTGLLLCVGGVFIVMLRMRGHATGREYASMKELDNAASRAKADLRSALSTNSSDDDDDQQGDEGGSSLAEAVIETVARDPGVVLSAAFAVASLLGPLRTIRVASRVAAVSGMIASIKRSMNNQHDDGDPRGDRLRNGQMRKRSSEARREPRNEPEGAAGPHDERRRSATSI